MLWAFRRAGREQIRRDETEQNRRAMPQQEGEASARAPSGKGGRKMPWRWLSGGKGPAPPATLTNGRKMPALVDTRDGAEVVLVWWCRWTPPWMALMEARA
ncbi:hypothetical protein U1Q18_000287 [Sarracenia purpurea var. burkii]